VQSVFRLALDLRRAIRACLRWSLHLGRVLAPPADLGAVEVRSPRLVGYARVSTDEQTTTLQLDALRSAGCAVIDEDSVSGASRPRLKRAIDELAGGDTLVVWKLDRLGRTLKDLPEVAESLCGRDVALRSLTEHIDTRTAAGKMLYAVLGAWCQVRSLMRVVYARISLPTENGV
jgi:Resolvase, N terminal domain